MPTTNMEEAPRAKTVGLRTRTAKTETSAKRAWLEDRRTYLGATDIAPILGVSPFSTPHDVWLTKRGLKETPVEIHMLVGIALEPTIAKLYQDQTGLKVLRSKTYKHSKFPYLACNPDREVALTAEGQKLRGLIECKSVGYWPGKNFGTDGADQIPEHYMMQILWQLIITKADFVHLAALIDNRDFRVFTYTLNPQLSQFGHVFSQDLAVEVFNRAKRWWELHMIEGVEPDLVGSEVDHEWIQGERATYDNGLLTNADEKIDRECILLEKAMVRTKRAQFVELGRKNRIKQFMAEEKASELEATPGRFRYKLDVRGIARFTTPYRTDRA